MTGSNQHLEPFPTGERIAEIIDNVQRETGYGPDRTELAAIVGCRSSRNIPGLRDAQKAGLVRYDENERLVLA